MRLVNEYLNLHRMDLEIGSPHLRLSDDKSTMPGKYVHKNGEFTLMIEQKEFFDTYGKI